MSFHVRTGALAAAAALTCTAFPAGLAIGQGIGPAEAVNDIAIAIQDTTLSVAAPGVLGNDQVLASEPGAPSYTTCPSIPGASGTDTLEFRSLAPRIVTNVGVGTLTLQLDGSYTFVPAPGFAGTATFPYSLANIDELPQCPVNPRLNATLTIEVVATAQGSFDGTFTPVSARTGPCILVDTTTIVFGDVPTGSTSWAAPSNAQTTNVSSCAPTDQFVNATVTPALGGGTGTSAVSLAPTDDAVPTINQFSYGVAARNATSSRPAVPGTVLTSVASEISSLQRQSGTLTIEHYLIGPATGTLVAGTGFRFAVTFIAIARG